LTDPTPPAAARPAILPTPEHAEIALREFGRLMTPVVRWLLRSGVPYPQFSEALKAVFVAVARAEIERGGAAATQSSISVLSGVHRKDVRAILAGAGGTGHAAHAVPLASQVYTRWLSEPGYRGADGTPLPVPRGGPAPSFDALARAASTDVHPRTVLEELLRLGLVRVDGDRVVPLATSFVPADGLPELVALFAANVGDHVAAAVHNLSGDGPRMLEQAVFATGLAEQSAQELALAAREAWAKAFDAIVAGATERVDRDRHGDGSHRVRFGAYFYTEPGDAPPASPGSGGAS
jgi:hypothetical protein